MYTTPRKVKQESRLRRSMSLTNNNNNGVRTADPTENDSIPLASTTSPYYTLSNRHSHHQYQHHPPLNGIAELPVSASASLADPFSSCVVSTHSKGIPIDCRSRVSFSSQSNATIIPDVIDVNQQPDGGTSLDFQNSHPYPHHHQRQYSYSGPPPYRNPPQQSAETSLVNGQAGVGPGSPQSVPDSPVDAYHTHSAKFPIVKEVIISETEIRNPTPTTTAAAPSSALSAGPVPSTSQQQRSLSSGTLPRLTASSSVSNGAAPKSASPSTLTPEYIKKFQNKKLTKHLAWKDERRALTLDSETAKELQNQLVAAQAQKSLSGTSTIRRSGSAFELERLIEAFNQEQHALVMSSLHQGLVPGKTRLDGIDNPALDLGSQTNLSPQTSSASLTNGHYSLSQPHTSNSNSSSVQQQQHQPSGKMAGYSFSDSSASQSLSLSSSNTDSLDTVIYKGPNTAAPSVRDWQRSKDSLQQADFGQPGGYRTDSQGMFDNRAYPMQQPSSSSSSVGVNSPSSVSYQPMQFNGPGGGNSGNVVMSSGQTPSSVMVSNGYSMEYRHQQQVQQQQQQQQQLHNLSVQSVHQSQQLHQQQNGGMMMRQHNGTVSQQQPFGSSMLPTKSPMVGRKTMLPPPGPSPNSSSNQSVSGVNGGGVGVTSGSNLKPSLNGGHHQEGPIMDKGKDSTKMFPTKTYNHIKDMISSRFGSSSNNSSTGLPPKGLNNSSVVNNNASNSNNNAVNQNGGFGMNGQNNGNAYLETQQQQSMGIPTYGMNQHGHLHSHSIHDTFGGGGPAQQQQQQQPQAPYYTAPPAVSPQQNGNANSYRSPPMNDRKNVNTSFRKAIHQSTLKSNLTEESLQLRPIMESSANMNGGSNRDLYRAAPQYSHQQQQNGSESSQGRSYGLSHQQEPNSPSMIPHHIERAQRALDKLCEPASGNNNGAPFTRTGSGPMTHHHQQNGMSRLAYSGGGGGSATSNAEESFGGSSSNNNNRPLYSLNGKLGSSQLTGVVGSAGGVSELGAIPRNRFSVTPGPSSSTSTNSSSAAASGGGMGAAATMSTTMASIESSLTLAANKQSLGHQLHQNPTANGNANSKTGSSNSSANNDQMPPPLPTSQKPEMSGASSGLQFQTGNSNNSSSHNTLGLPPVLPSVLAGEKRENGDGSSGTMENPSSASLHLESTGAGPSGNNSNASSSALALNKSKSEQLKKITADLHNLAISVAAEQHFHHSQQLHHHHLQFAAGSVGSAGANGGSANSNNNQSGTNNNNNSSSSECENKGSQRIGSGQSHTTSDSGVGTVMLTKSPLNSISDHESKGGSGGGVGPSAAELLLVGEDHNVMDSVSSGNDSEWVDIVEPEIRQILELEKKSKSGKLRTTGDKMTGVALNGGLATSTPAHIAQVHHGKTGHHGISGKVGGGDPSDLIGDLTASPIPHHRLLSGSPTQSPKIPKKFDLNAYNKKAAQNRSQELLAGPSTSTAAQNGAGPSGSKVKSPRTATKVSRSNSGAQRYGRASRGDKGGKNAAANRLIKDLGLKGIKLSRHAASQILYPQDDNGDMTSTTTGLDLESMLDGQTEQTSDDDDDMSTTIDTTDAHAIRRQLESLESMYTEVLKVLGAKRFSGNRYPTSDLRNAKRRPYGSMSSLPSSVSSRPFRERKLKLDDKKKVKDIKSINKRFQRLESHVVTLARSVAHLSSEMRTQHLMVQEIESIRNEMQQLRNQVLKSSMQNQSAAAAAAAAQNFARVSSGRNGAGVHLVNATDWTSFRNALPSLTNPCRVRKLTKFFGDEPPLVRIFLKKLGYEKYASAFEQERIGIMELPYLTEERLNKMGIPMGPRLRILQEAQLCLKPGYHPNHETHHNHHQSNNHGPGNLSVYVV